MTDRTPDDRTRDITLPPLPHRPPPVLPPEWAGERAASGPVDAPTTAVPGPARPPAAPIVPPQEEGEAAPDVAEERWVASRRTDELAQPPAAARERTLAFSAPEMQHRSIEPVRVEPTPRRWPWVVLTLLPVLVIVGFGIAWLILLGGM